MTAGSNGLIALNDWVISRDFFQLLYVI